LNEFINATYQIFGQFFFIHFYFLCIMWVYDTSWLLVCSVDCIEQDLLDIRIYKHSAYFQMNVLFPKCESLAKDWTGLSHRC